MHATATAPRPLGSINSVPPIRLYGAGYAIPGDRGFTGQRGTAYGRLGASAPTADQLQALSSAQAVWQAAPARSPRADNTPSSTYRFAVLPTPGGVNAASPTAVAQTAPVDGTGDGGTSTVSTPETALMAPVGAGVTIVQVGLAFLVAYVGYTLLARG